MKTNYLHLESFDKAEKQSHQTPVIILKHSNTCPISTGAYDRVSELGKDVYLVVVQEQRPLSNEIEAKTGVQHESPQILIIKDGKVTYHASHRAITAEVILQQL